MSDLNPVILIAVLLSMVACGIVVFILTYQKKQLQNRSEREQMKTRFDKEILESKLEIQEQTMKHISQEVHDNIGQVLSVVKLNLNLMDCADAALPEKIKDTTELVGKVIQDLRDLSKSLHSDIITERGLIKAIEYECELLKKTGAYTTNLMVTGEPQHLPEQKELILFRIFQEVLNNTLKHAGASLIEVWVEFQTQKFSLRIRDNGKGFDTAKAGNGNSLGIRNIINRSELIGAYYHIDSKESEGTSVRVELPLPQLPAGENSGAASFVT